MKLNGALSRVERTVRLLLDQCGQLEVRAVINLGLGAGETTVVGIGVDGPGTIGITDLVTVGQSPGPAADTQLPTVPFLGVRMDGSIAATRMEMVHQMGQGERAKALVRLEDRRVLVQEPEASLS